MNRASTITRRLVRPRFPLSMIMWVTAACAVLVWWNVRPRHSDQPLADGFKLRVPRIDSVDPDTGEERLVPHGVCVLLDERNFVRGRGRYFKGQATGRWTYFDPAGRRVLQGEFHEGQRVGRWTTWNDEGRKASATEYEEHLGGTMRSWWKNGQLKSEGPFKHGRPHGHWKNWNEDGSLVSQGDYVRGKRNGVWRLNEQGGKRSSTVYYLEGKETRPFAELVPLLKDQLNSDQWLTARDAGRRLALIGSSGTEVLIEAMRDGPSDRRIHAIRGCLANDQPTDEVRSAVIKLMRDDDPTVQAVATSAVHALCPDKRTVATKRLLRLAAEHPRLRGQIENGLVEQAEFDWREFEASLSDDDIRVRQFACRLLSALLVARLPLENDVRDPRRLQRTTDRILAILRRAESSSRHEDVVRDAKAAVEEYERQKNWPPVFAHPTIPVVG